MVGDQSPAEKVFRPVIRAVRAGMPHYETRCQM
jgi:hypothetical protein